MLLDLDPPDLIDGGALDQGAPMDAAVGDAPMTDAPVRDASSTDLGPDASGPCSGAPDGTDCTGVVVGPARLVCIRAACVPSSCGDGFVDVGGGEQCDPLGDSACDPRTCRYECSVDAECPAFSVCVAGACSSHACVYAPAHDGMPCATGGTTTNVCSGGLCAPVGCGNGVVDGTEDCDPGTASIPGLGCHGCSFDCHSDDECDDGDPCDGVETCSAMLDGMGNVVGKTCNSGRPFICPTPPVCFTGGCFVSDLGVATCGLHLLDGDGDGFAAGSGCGSVGGDCDDADPNVHPGATEACNMVDDDCNGLVDDHTMVVTWCPDGDGDGFGDATMSVTSCMAPPGPFTRDCSDCWDTPDPLRRREAALVNPLQAAFFTTPYCPIAASPASCTFDYDCDGTETQQTVGTVSCSALAPLVCGSAAGWAGPATPACGAMATFATCHGVMIGPISVVCSATTSTQTQACH